MKNRIAVLLCRLFGHKPVSGPLKPSPNTVHTHYQDVCCSRCGEYLHFIKHYIDARTKR